MTEYLSSCELCPRRCAVDRLKGQTGYCGAGCDVEIFSYGAHNGEEPVISGTRGSGTVFFSTCTLGCIYCQNYPWSQENDGERYNLLEFEALLRTIAESGCHNWNFVSPTPWIEHIQQALNNLKVANVSLPVVYNTSGYERLKTLRRIKEFVDIYLVDLRYSRQATALNGSGVPDYVAIARAAFMEMWQQVGPLRLDNEGIAVEGLICRLLILPNRAEETVENLEWLADKVGTDVAVSVMAQYVPAYKAASIDGWDRTIREDEYRLVTSAIDELGFENGWVQDFTEPTAGVLVGFNMNKKSRK